ncbi:MAG: hypothetical protein VXY27_05325, partial [Thermoproteota archaeon]|nr:hypothetical protein [Thermoproteota archaeon]
LLRPLVASSCALVVPAQWCLRPACRACATPPATASAIACLRSPAQFAPAFCHASLSLARESLAIRLAIAGDQLLATLATLLLLLAPAAAAAAAAAHAAPLPLPQLPLPLLLQPLTPPPPLMPPLLLHLLLMLLLLPLPPLSLPLPMPMPPHRCCCSLRQQLYSDR